MTVTSRSSERFAVALSLMLLCCTSALAGTAAGGRDSIDPGEASQQGVWRGDIIDPQSLRPNFQPSYNPDPGTARLERYQWQNADPGPIFDPIVPETWASTHELVVKQLPGVQNDLPSVVEGQLAPNTLDEYQAIAPDSAVLNPVDPGAAEMRANLFGRVDPGRLPDQLGGPGGGLGRSAIFFQNQYESQTPAAGVPSRRAKLRW